MIFKGFKDVMTVHGLIFVFLYKHIHIYIRTTLRFTEQDRSLKIDTNYFKHILLGGIYHSGSHKATTTTLYTVHPHRQNIRCIFIDPPWGKKLN